MDYDVLYILGFCIYVIVTYIMWRNIEMMPIYKSLFCFLVVPIFFLGIWINLSLFDLLYSELFEIHDNARGGKHGPKGIFAFILSMPIALALSYAWYRLMESKSQAI